MSTDFESAFYRIVADNFSPDDNLPDFPYHAPARFHLPERVAEDVPVIDRSRVRRPVTDPRRLLTGPAVARLETHAASLDGSWVSPRTGLRYTVGETIGPDDMAPPATNEHNATYNHPGNPNPFLQGPRNAAKPDDTEE